MKVKNGYILREIAGSSVIIPVGERVIEFKGMMTPNETGAFIWRQLASEITYEQLLDVILAEYDVDEETARADLDEFLESARNCGVIEE
jgi:hypothetical protein